MKMIIDMKNFGLQADFWQMFFKKSIYLTSNYKATIITFSTLGMIPLFLISFKFRLPYFLCKIHEQISYL